MESFLNPEEVLNKLELHSNMIAADFGCGSGGFTITLAKKLDKGIVYGLDVQEPPLSALKARSISENINNIKVIRCNLEKEKGTTLLNSSLDLVLIVNTLFQSEDKTAIISEAERVLKPRAKLLIIDWMEEVKQGPQNKKVSVSEIKKIAEKQGFKLEKELKAGKYHFCLIFKKL